MHLLFVFLTFFIWSTSFTIGKTTLEYCPPLFLTATRMILAGVLLLSFLYCFYREKLLFKKKMIFPLALLGLTSVYITNALEFWGLQYLTSAKACFIYSLSPFLSTIFSYFQFREKITSKKVLGLMIGFLGFIPVLIYQSEKESLFGGVIFSWAEIALIVATIFSVYGWILLRKLGKEENMSPLFANGASMVIGGFFALMHSLIAENWSPTPVSEFIPFAKGVIMMIIVSNLICYNLYGYLLKHFTATFLSFAGLMTPLFAAFFGWLILKENVSWSFFLAIGIIFFGLWLVYSEELRLGYILKKSSPVPKPEKILK